VQQTLSSGEVVLCAGAIGSPHLLHLSGIGPSAQLTAVGVKVVADLPGVGQNLQDHILLAGIRFHSDSPFPERGMGEGTTVLARAPGNDRGPDLHLMAMGLDFFLPGQEPSPNSYTFGIAHVRPHSRGEVRLISADPRDAPAIDPRYLHESHDLAQLILGVETVDQIVRTGVFHDWGGYSDTTRLLQLDDLQLEQAVRDALYSYSHYAGTCRIGNDADAVVSTELRVHGIDGLRVADASVMPTIVSCNTNAASVMIGEKAADLVRGVGLPKAD
jgi:choline dehydrogenase